MQKKTIILAINSQVDDELRFKNKFEILQKDIDDCLPINQYTEGFDYRIIDINKVPEEAERLNIKATPTLIFGNVKILGLDDLRKIVKMIGDHTTI